MLTIIIMRESGQVSADYIVGITLFLFGVFIVFYISTNIISPLSGEYNEKQFIAEAISDFLLVELSDDSSNVVNLTKMEELFSDYTNFLDEIGLSNTYYQINVTVRTINGLEIASVGPTLPYYADLGYIKRFLVSDELNEQMAMEVYVW
jgi:hypothetical protein